MASSALRAVSSEGARGGVAGVGQRGDAGGGGQQERPEDGPRLALVVLELQVVLQVWAARRWTGCGRGYDGVGASLPPVMTPFQKSLFGGALRPSTSTLRQAGQFGTTERGSGIEAIMRTGWLGRTLTIDE